MSIITSVIITTLFRVSHYFYECAVGFDLATDLLREKNSTNQACTFQLQI